MADELVETRDSRGVTQWASKATGEVVTHNAMPYGRIHSVARDHLFESEPRLLELLQQGKPLSWYELSRVIDVLMRATTVDAARGLMDARTLKEIQRCVSIMSQAQSLSKRLDPLNPAADQSAKRASTQKLATAILALPQ